MTEPERVLRNQIESSTIKKVELPESTDGRLNALLPPISIGPISVTVLLLSYNDYISSAALARSFREVFMGTDVESFHKNVALGYCMKSLYPNGLVTQEVIRGFGEERLGLGLTEAGGKYGTIAACLSLHFEQQHKQSLYPVFGQASTNSPEQLRAPYTRARILLLLDKEPELSRGDVCKDLCIDEATAGQNLEALTKAGAIDYEAVTLSTGKIQVTYALGELPAPQAQKVKDMPIFTKEIMGYCEELASQGEDITQDAIFRKFPQERHKRYKNESDFRGAVSGVLSGLASQGYLQRGKFEGKKVQSVGKIIQLGQTVVDDFLAPLVSFVQDDSATREWLEREVVPQVKGNLKFYAQNSAELYYPHSKSFKMRQNQENIGRLNSILSDNSEELTASQLSDQLRLSRRTIYSLASMASNIQREKRKGVYYYRAKPAILIM